VLNKDVYNNFTNDEKCVSWVFSGAEVCRCRFVLLVGPELMLLLARHNDLHRVSLDTEDHLNVVLNIQIIGRAVAIDFDPVEQMVYWTDVDARAIGRAFLNGSGNI